MTAPLAYDDRRIRIAMARYSTVDTARIAQMLDIPEAHVYRVWIRTMERKRAIKALVRQELEKRA